MLLGKPEDLRAAAPAGSRLLGLDLGTRTIGLALSDTTWTIASPFDTIRRTKFTQDAEKLLKVIETENVGALVIGLPVNMDGSEGPRCQATRAFADNLLKKREIPILFWDERLSTAAVERMLVKEMDVSRKQRAQVVDKLAAGYILQGLLDALTRS